MFLTNIEHCTGKNKTKRKKINLHKQQ